MKEWIQDLNQTINTSVKEWTAVPKATWVKKPHPEKWSKAEVVGHLIDSAQNNIQRFIRAQYEGAPNHFYNQNEWVRFQHHATVPKRDLIRLWALLNKQVCHIIANMPAENLELPCYFKVNGVLQTVSLRYVIEDYLEHLKHHLKQIENI
jgi:DinB superfamily